MWGTLVFSSRFVRHRPGTMSQNVVQTDRCLVALCPRCHDRDLPMMHATLYQRNQRKAARSELWIASHISHFTFENGNLPVAFIAVACFCLILDLVDFGILTEMQVYQSKPSKRYLHLNHIETILNRYLLWSERLVHVARLDSLSEL